MFHFSLADQAMHLMLKSKKKQVCATQRRSQKKISHILYPSGIEFIHSKRREQVHKIQQLAMWSPMLGYLPPFWQKRFLCIHHTSCCNRRIMTIPLGLKIQKAGGLPEGHWHMCLRRTKEYTLSLKQGKMFPQGHQPRTGCLFSLLLGSEVFLHALKDDGMHQTAIPNFHIFFSFAWWVPILHFTLFNYQKLAITH